jgi:O-glycosyl hydrolase
MYVSPWSPPAFMKNGSMLQGGKLKGSFISLGQITMLNLKAYEKEGFHMGNDDSK